ncbi:MAG: OmpH family outer membrane protein [Bacteroidales bacterium]|nr:OmpH family outer membrane protein [Bacteroidales bacterium]
MQDEIINQDAEMPEPLKEQEIIVPEKVKKTNYNAILTVTNVVLFVGLIVLYFLVLKPGGNEPTNMALVQKVSGGSVTVAYVNSDSILVHYDLVKSMRKDLEAKTARLENELKSKQASFEKDAAYFQEQVSKKTISEASAQEIYGQLMGEQQKLYELREQYSNDLSKQEFDLNVLLIDSLNNFLERYNQKMHFDYILSYNKGGSILAANDSLDITRDVLKLLNEEFTTGKK